jgi:putative addiction module antidote
MKATITRIGDGSGVVLPSEMLQRLELTEGDTVYVTETEDGIQISSHEPSLNEIADIARDIMEEDRDLLKKLAE